MQNGFSLIELCAVIAIMGLVLVGVADSYRIHYQYKQLTQTYAKFNNIDQALSEFYAVTGRYPCPSDPMQPLGATSGIEQVDFTHNVCIQTGGIVRTTTGTRRTQANQNPVPATDYIAIGAFPYQTVMQTLSQNNLPTLISQYDTLDSWNNQLTYAVTESMATQTTTSPTDGAIFVETENFHPACTPGATPSTCQDLTNPPGSAHLVLISHGDDGVGAYNQQGLITTPCPAPGTTADAQNCQYNSGLFINGLRSMGPGATYFDDEVYFRAVALNALWAPVNNPANPRPDIYNVNAGNVGIGTGNSVPQAQLEVDGILHAAGNVNVPLICDPSNVYCFDPAFIGGPVVTSPATPQAPHPNTCPTGWIMTGIANSNPNDPTTYQVTCQQPPTNSTVSAITCPPAAPGSPAWAVYGFQALGGGVWTPLCLPVTAP